VLLMLLPGVLLPQLLPMMPIDLSLAVMVFVADTVITAVVAEAHAAVTAAEDGGAGCGGGG